MNRQKEFNKLSRLVFETFDMLNIMSTDFLKIINEVDRNQADKCWQRLAIIEAIAIIDSIYYRLDVISESSMKFQNIRKRFYRKKEKYLITASSFGIDIEIKIDDKDWVNYQKARTIRKKIVHPKSKSDLEVSDEDYYLVSEAFEWIWNQFSCFVDELKKVKAGTVGKTA